MKIMQEGKDGRFIVPTTDQSIVQIGPINLCKFKTVSCKGCGKSFRFSVTNRTMRKYSNHRLNCQEFEKLELLKSCDYCDMKGIKGMGSHMKVVHPDIYLRNQIE